MSHRYQTEEKDSVNIEAAPPVHLALLLILAISIVLTACGGNPAPMNYTCGTPSRGHCYGEVTGLSGLLRTSALGNINGLYGYRTSIYTAHLTGGDGFIDNEFWLNSKDCYCWIEAGYMTYPVGGVVYFWAQQSPPDGLFVAHYLGSVPQQDYGHYGTYDIHEIGKGMNAFVGSIVNMNTNYQFSTSNPMWMTHPYGDANEGQELAGTNGATAEFAFFEFNSWYDEQGVIHYITSDASVDAQNPPYADWFLTKDTPSMTNNGGLFFTECCSSQL